MRHVDLHIHTTFSDGRNSIEDVLEYAQVNRLSQFCITDHNTLAGAIALFESNRSDKILFGLETRLPGLPDFLLYFPRLDCAGAVEIQQEFDTIAQLDQDVTIESCAGLFKGDILSEWRRCQFYNTTGNRWLGTLQLAQLLSDNVVPDSHIVSQIRRMKSGSFSHPEGSRSAQQLLDRAQTHWLTDLTSRHDGYVSLAHPFREIVRRNRDCPAFDFQLFSEALGSLLTEMKREGVDSVEHITAYMESWWVGHFKFSLSDANRELFSLCDSIGLSLTCGSDSHDFRKTYDLLAPCENVELQTRLANWIL